MADGNSSRMGVEKALIVYDGQKLIERAASLLIHFCDSILISSNKTYSVDFEHERVKDEHQNIGPISGLYSALNVSENDHNIVIPCDTPFVNIDIYRQLLLHSKTSDAVVAGTLCNFVEPLVAYYNKSVIKTLIRQIEKGDYKLNNILKVIQTEVVVFPDKSLFMNINTPSDLVSLRKLEYDS